VSRSQRVNSWLHADWSQAKAPTFKHTQHTQNAWLPNSQHNAQHNSQHLAHSQHSTRTQHTTASTLWSAISLIACSSRRPPLWYQLVCSVFICILPHASSVPPLTARPEAAIWRSYQRSQVGPSWQPNTVAHTAGIGCYHTSPHSQSQPEEGPHLAHF
jgi:hypothetical protein